MLESIFTLR